MILRLQDDGAGEHSEVKAERLSETVGGTAEVSNLYASILETDPESLTAIKYFMKLHRYNDDEEEGAWFVKLVDAIIKRDFQSTVRLIRDYFPNHLNCLTGDILFRVGVEFYQYADYEKARLCLDLAATKEGPWQAKAMLILSRTYEALGNPDRAAVALEELLDQEYEETFRRQAAIRLMQLREEERGLRELTNVA